MPASERQHAGLLLSKEVLWLACKEKTCCSVRVVFVTDRDVARIASAMHVEPWSFLAYYETPPRPDAFILDASGQHYCLALAKQPTRRTVTPAPCIFLVQTRDRYRRCGLGDLRPAACKTFPSEIVEGVLHLALQSGCSCRTWSHGDVDIEAESTIARWREAELSDYCSVVARWNDLVLARQAGDDEFDLDDFCAYLLSTSDAARHPIQAVSL